MAKTRCPICNTEFEKEKSEFMPFCSKRCSQVDLSRWLGEEYGFPVEPERDFDYEEGAEE